MTAEANVSAALAEVKCAAVEEVAALMAKHAAELLKSEARGALADAWLREAAVGGARLALEAALDADRSDCGAGNAPECAGCGERMRYVSREAATAESALGGSRCRRGATPATAARRRACARACGSWSSRGR